MNLPKTIDVCGSIYLVSIGQPEEPSDLGETDFLDREIIISENLLPERRWEVLLHELVHVALYETGATNIMGAEQEENICDSVSFCLRNVLELKREGK